MASAERQGGAGSSQPDESDSQITVRVRTLAQATHELRVPETVSELHTSATPCSVPGYPLSGYQRTLSSTSTAGFRWLPFRYIYSLASWLYAACSALSSS